MDIFVRGVYAIVVATLLTAANTPPAFAEPKFKPFPSPHVVESQWRSYYSEVKAAYGGSVQEFPQLNLVVFSTAGATYAFTTAGHPAHPAWVSKRVVPARDGEGWAVEQVGYFAGQEKAFAELFRQYQQLTEVMRTTWPAHDPASGLGVAPPAGYAARLMPTKEAPQTMILVSKIGQPTTECYVAFQELPAFAQITQQAINANSLNVYLEGIAASYDVSEIEPFEHDGVRGARLFAVSRTNAAIPNWTPNLPTYLFVFYTPKGRTAVTCYWDKAALGVPREEFIAIVHAVTLPR
jgi:hypothetical protein